MSEDVRALMDRVAALIEEAEHADPVSRQRLKAVLGAVLEVHGLALHRVREIVGDDAFSACAADPVVGTVLLMHDLHPVGLADRVKSALPEGSTVMRADEELVWVQVPSGTPRRWVEARLAEMAPEALSVRIDAEAT